MANTKDSGDINGFCQMAASHKFSQHEAGSTERNPRLCQRAVKNWRFGCHWRGKDRLDRGQGLDLDRTLAYALKYCKNWWDMVLPCCCLLHVQSQKERISCNRIKKREVGESVRWKERAMKKTGHSVHHDKLIKKSGGKKWICLLNVMSFYFTQLSGWLFFDSEQFLLEKAWNKVLNKAHALIR